MAKITIEIDNDGEACGGCRFLEDVSDSFRPYPYVIYFCDLYRATLTNGMVKTGPSGPDRCEACLDAEVKG